MKLQLSAVKNEERTSKNGKPYTACSINANGEWYNGFGSQVTKGWKSGDEIEVEVYEEEFNGKMYKKFKAPKDTDALKSSIDLLAKEVSSLKNRMSILEKGTVSTEPQNTIDDLPF